MQEIPGDLMFMKSHEWARTEEDGRITVGISEFAQGELGDVVYVDLPAVGDEMGAGDDCAVVESVKAASDIYAPVAGTIVAINNILEDAPETINADPYGDGWLFAIQPDEGADKSALLSPDAYAALIEAAE